MRLKVTVNQVPYEVEVEVDHTPASLPPVYIGGGAGPLPVAASASAQNMIVAPLAGSVRKIFVGVGASVVAGEVVALLEAMKMETEIQAPVTGKITKILSDVGAAVQGGDPIMSIDPEK